LPLFAPPAPTGEGNAAGVVPRLGFALTIPGTTGFGFAILGFFGTTVDAADGSFGLICAGFAGG
jgi:hypothetical protein